MLVRYFPVVVLPMLAACTVGPEYERPQVAGEAGEWTAEASVEPVDLEPWRKLDDPLLVELIETAVASNLDLREAEARLAEARAMRDVVAGGKTPELNAIAGISEWRTSGNGQYPVNRIPGVERSYSLFEAGFDASWELDLWGRTARAIEAATLRMEAAEARRRETVLRIVAEVERNYAELRGAQAEAEIRRAEAEALGEQAKLLLQLRRAGEVGLSDEVEADVAAQSAIATIPGTEARTFAAANALALLAGQPPEAFSERLLQSAPMPAVPDQVAVGLRSELLRRRPDIMIAEAQLAALTADVGVETANLFPRLSLAGNVGIQDRSGGELFKTGSTYYSIGPGLHWPILARGRIKAQIRAASARADAAGAAYERAVLSALADSETALNRYDAAVRTARALQGAQDRSDEALNAAEARYRRGEDSRLQALQARTRHMATRRATLNARMNALLAHAALVKALGGGWSGTGDTDIEDGPDSTDQSSD